VRVQSVNEEMAEALGVKENVGALIAAVTKDGPADKAGIQPEDLILKFDGKDVTTVRGLPRLVAQSTIGKTVEVEILRKGQRIVRKVVVGRLAEGEEAAKQAGGERSGTAALPGLTLAPLSEELRKKHGYDSKAKGVVITQIDQASEAGKKNLKVGDLIVEAGQEPAATVDDVATSVERVRKSGRKAILLRVEDSKGDLRFVAVPIN
jgi:serine protease Do